MSKKRPSITTLHTRFGWKVKEGSGFFFFFFFGGGGGRVVRVFVCLFGFLTSSSTTRLYRGRAPRQSV